MRKIVFILGLFFSASLVFAQNLVVTGGDYFTSDPLIDISHHLDVKNIALYPINVICTKTIISSPNGLPSWAGASYCFAGNCYSTSSTAPSNAAVLGPGQSFSYQNNDLDAFSGYYTPGGTVGNTVVEYCFSDQNNPTDKSCVTITYEISNNTTGLDEFTKRNVFYPNPARGIVNFEYEFSNSAELVIIDVLGKEITNIELINKGTKKINISNLPKGIYFGNVIIGQDIVEVKKLIIR